MNVTRIQRVSRRGESSEHYYRLYSILKSVLPEYVGRISLIEHASSDDLYSYALFLGEDVVGGYVLQTEGEVACLEFIGLTQGVRGKGLGSLIGKDIAVVSRGLDVKRILAETSHENLSIFNKMGFKLNSKKDFGMMEICKELN